MHISSSGHLPGRLDQARGALRRKRSSLRIEMAHIGWVRRFIRVDGLRHPRELLSGDIGAFLTCLAVEQVAAEGQASCWQQHVDVAGPVPSDKRWEAAGPIVGMSACFHRLSRPPALMSGILRGEGGAG
ncbi:MAG: hypothetical protein N2378_11645 [Chloroflexaceae bacterium]|nr:hypothetical protein [Chloroflexaceae bacterium]